MKKQHLVVVLFSLSLAACAGLTKQPPPYDPIVEAQAFCSRLYGEATTLDQEIFQARAAAARKKYPDFDAVVFNEELSITETMRDLILASEVGPEIAYYLGHHADEARTIARLSPVAQANALGRIEVRIAAVFGRITSVIPSVTASDAIRSCVERTARQGIEAQ